MAFYRFLKFMRRFVMPLWKWYLGGIIALIATNITTLEIPQFAKYIVNHFGDESKASELRGYALGLIALGCTVIFIRVLSRILIFYPGRKLEANLRSFFFAKMLSVRESFFEGFGMGELIARLNNDIGQLRAFFAFGVLQLMNLILLIIFTVSNMLSVHVTLTFVALGPLVLLVGFLKTMFTRMHELSLQNQEAVGRLTNRVTESFVNVHVIKANSAEDSFLERAELENEAVYSSNIKSVVLRTVFFPLMNATMNLGQVGVVCYGGYEVIHNRLTVGDILAFNVYIAYLSFPLSAIGIIVSLYQRCVIALDRLDEISKAQDEEGDQSVLPDASVPVLRISNLSFDYRSKDKDHKFGIKGISLELFEGEKVGIYGPIGSGKTTLFSLISRLQDPPVGSIFLYGVDITTLEPQILRQLIGYAQQTVSLFSASVTENLRLGAPSVAEEDLRAAAEAADVMNDIERMPQGWNTEIGEKGIRLSGGQKQRLALARIFLRRPKLMLLDDVLSAVDQQTEQRIAANIRSSRSAVIVASHRVSALRDCREVIYMDEGRILDRGTFAEMQQRHSVFSEDHHDAT